MGKSGCGVGVGEDREEGKMGGGRGGAEVEGREIE